MGPVQNSFGRNFSVIALDNPPEGQMVVPLLLTISPQAPSETLAPALQDLHISQVRTIYVDNTANPNPLTVTHGAALQNTNIPANGGGYIPTTSTTGAYYLTVSPQNASDVIPPEGVDIPITLYNYEIAPAIFGSPIIRQVITMAADTLPNPFYNSSMAVSQVNTGGIIAIGGYTVDGFYTTPLGASPQTTWLQGASIGQGTNSLTLLSAVTSPHNVTRRVVSANAGLFSGERVCFQCKMLNTGGADLPNMTVSIMSTNATSAKDTFADPFAAVNPPVTLLTVPLQVAKNGALTQLSAVFDMPTNISNGFQVVVSTVDAIVHTGSPATQWCDFDMTLAPGVTVGLNNAPPSPRFKYYGENLSECETYYEIFAAGFYNGQAAALAAWGAAINYRKTKFKQPTLSLVITTTSTNIAASPNGIRLFNGGDKNGCIIGANAAAAGAMVFETAWAADARP